MNQSDARLVIKVYLCFSCYYILSVFVISPFIYHFILWNLFLAMIPLGIMLVLQLNLKHHPQLSGWNVCLGFLWLFFFPNAPYLITDLLHMNAMPFYQVGISAVGIEYWVSLLHIGGGILLGLFAGMYSLMMMHEMILLRVGKRVGTLLLMGICVATGYGVYIGRFIRFNTWDLLRPWEVVKTLFDQISVKGAILSSLFAIFTLLCYLLFYLFLNARKNTVGVVMGEGIELIEEQKD